MEASDLVKQLMSMNVNWMREFKFDEWQREHMRDTLTLCGVYVPSEEFNALIQSLQTQPPLPLGEWFTPRPTSTTVMLATPSPYPPLQTPEAWCLAIVNGNPLNGRDAANGRNVMAQIPYNTVVAFDEATRKPLGGYTWVQLREPVRYNGLWVALSLLRGVQC